MHHNRSRKLQKRRNEILQLRRDYTRMHDHFLQMMMKRRVLSSEYNQGISSEHSVLLISGIIFQPNLNTNDAS